jgi:4-aminobutyrate aminotransferase-like enzyme
VTHAIADFSPSEWPRGVQPAAVETYPAPNTYRGRYADAPDPASEARAQIVAALERVAGRDRSPAALFIDATFTADGIFVPLAPVVRAVVESAREAGAFYVADEVQSGYGRTGDGLWGFEAWGVTPDIVTLGKPMGNGHPVAAVITRSDIVDRFAEQTTFFSTFGGNPVACAAALAVLDVIGDEGLVANAAAVGDWLRARLVELATRHPVIGDVRGRGLMTGVELIGPDGTSPAPELASRAKDAMAEHGVLIGTAGRSGNTLKIRPPLCITRDEARLIVDALDEVLD